MCVCVCGYAPTCLAVKLTITRTRENWGLIATTKLIETAEPPLVRFFLIVAAPAQDFLGRMPWKVNQQLGTVQGIKRFAVPALAVKMVVIIQESTFMETP